MTQVRTANGVAGVDVGAQLDQLQHHRAVATARSKVQRSAAFRVRRV